MPQSFRLTWKDKPMLGKAFRVMSSSLNMGLGDVRITHLMERVVGLRTRSPGAVESLLRDHDDIAFQFNDDDDVATFRVETGTIAIDLDERTITLTHRDEKVVRRAKGEWQLTPL